MSNVLLPRTLRRDNSFQRYIRVISASLLLVAVGCTKERSLQAELSLKVEPSNRPGVYVVSGKTNLPDQSRIIVQGIRPLTSTAESTNTENSPNYAILDRQAVVSSQGQWQATLKLWESTPDGQYQEAWQANQAYISRLKPDADVVFVAAIESAGQTKASAQPLNNQGNPLEGANIRFATNGQWYLEAKQTLTVSPPISKTSLSALKTNDPKGDSTTQAALPNLPINVISANLSASKEKQTTAPLSFSQRLR
jgi:hypothetical protein